MTVSLRFSTDLAKSRVNRSLRILMKIKFNEKKTTQIKLKEDKILSGLRKKLNTVYDKTYKLNRHI